MRYTSHTMLATAAALALLLWSPTAPASERQGGTQRSNDPAFAAGLENKPLDAWRGELLDLAYEGASAFPVVPHIKNRSRAQEEVVRASLELGQPKRALRYIEGIDNWRRGAGYADLACYLIEHGDASQAARFLDRAESISLAKGLAQWRSDRIRVKIARAYTMLGREERAAEYVRNLGDPEIGKVTQVQAERSDNEAFDRRMREIEGLVSSGVFEKVRNGLRAYAALYRRFFEDEQKRERVMERVDAAWREMPGFVRLDLLIEMAGAALAHDGDEEALRLVGMAERMMDGAEGAPRREIPYRADLLKMRFRAGQEGRARAELDALLERFDAASDEMQDLHRADTLRPIAEAYAAMGLTQRSLNIYERVIKAGVVNPNIRPRITDFVSTCCSMVAHNAEPTENIWNRLRVIKEGLGHQ